MALQRSGVRSPSTPPINIEFIRQVEQLAFFLFFSTCLQLACQFQFQSIFELLRAWLCRSRVNSVLSFLYPNVRVIRQLQIKELRHRLTGLQTCAANRENEN